MLSASVIPAARRRAMLTFWRRLRRDRLALASLVFVVVLVLVAVAAPLVVSLAGAPGPDVQQYAALSRFGAPTGPSLAHHHIFGVETLGRDVFSRVVYGARVSLEVAVLATGIAVLLGVVLGTLAGYARGITDTLISRLVDLFLAFPLLLLALGVASACQRGCVAGLVHPGLSVVVVVIALVNWTYMARIVRGEVLSLRERDFIQAARAVGSGGRRIVVRELLPNLTAPIVVYATIMIPLNILLEAALSYLGVGVQPPTPSWGAMLADATPIFASAWWYMLFPGLALLLTVLAFNLLGDGLRDALSPRSHRSSGP
ncbi:MAG: ABC transporter permease [Solirubrobacteraceae bacterium]